REEVVAQARTWSDPCPHSGPKVAQAGDERLPPPGARTRRRGAGSLLRPFVDGGSAAAESHLATAFFRAEPADTLTPSPAGIWISSPVRGLRPVRAARSTRSTLSRPVTLTASPLPRDSTRTSCSAPSAASASVLVSDAFSAIAATRSVRLTDT